MHLTRRYVPRLLVVPAALATVADAYDHDADTALPPTTSTTPLSK